MAKPSPSPSSVGEEIDLHGLTVKQAMDRFVAVYNDRLSQGRRGAMRVVHGGNHGERIRRRLRSFLGEHEDKLDYRPGEDLEHNDGLTLIWPRQPLPGYSDLQEARILEYCLAPKTKAKIIRKFWRSSKAEVVSIVESIGKLTNGAGAIRSCRSSRCGRLRKGRARVRSSRNSPSFLRAASNQDAGTHAAYRMRCLQP